MKRKALTVLLAAVAAAAGIAAYEAADEVWKEDEYTLRMHMQVPRIYSNNESLGSRRYQWQNVEGDMVLQYNVYGQLIGARFTNMVNKTHMLANGRSITYNAVLDCSAAWPRFNAIGNNRTKLFQTASLSFAIAAEPSYNIGEFDEDNALYVMLAGRGTFLKRTVLKYATGYLAGTLGCGCHSYGHVSPTRKIGWNGPTDEVDDVAAVFGSWKLRLKTSR